MSVKESILAKFQEVAQKMEQPNVSNGSTSKPQDNGAKGNQNKRGKFYGKRRRDFGDQPRPKQKIHKGISENEVGITEFISTGKGFNGIIKHRFSDFQVHEIDLDGNRVVLDSTEIPQVIEETQPDEQYRSVLSDEQWASLEECINAEDNKTYEIDVTGKSKEDRSRIHKAIKREYGAKVFSNTQVKENETVLRVGKCTKNTVRNSWPKCQGRFLHFTLFKENLDTNVLVNALARKLKLKANHISFAGTKDKRGKTTQRMCVRNRRAEQLVDARIQQAQFGNFEYKHSPLRLGDLSGNEFTIVIRNVEATDDEIEESLTTVRDKGGFINYFGLQRFGSSALAPTYLIGRSLLLEDYEQAVSLIIKHKEGEKGSYGVQKACETYWKTKDAIAALKSAGSNIEGSIEGKILSSLKKQKDNFCNAIFALPRNTMLLYLHAYQSLIWNKIVSKRIQEFGTKPMAGDLVVVEECDLTTEPVSLEGAGDKPDAVSDSDEDEDVVKVSDEDPSVADKTKKMVKVKKLTADELDSVTLFDVVYPLPGKDVDFPDNIVAKWYEEFMAEDGLSMDHLKNSNKDFALYGAYRNILGKVSDLSWDIMKYDEVYDDLILSDLDKMQNKSLPTEGGSKYKAVVLSFKLKSSTYATMLLREVMKCDTSVSHQASLTRDTHSVNEEPPEKTSKLEDGGA